MIATWDAKVGGGAILILALTRYGRLGASSRVRSYQYQAPLAELGINLEIMPLFGDDYVHALYGNAGRGGIVLRAFANRVRTLLSAKRYDAVWVEKELLPWLPAPLELALLPHNVPLIVDYDDAVFHRYDMHRSSLVRTVLGRKLDRLMARADLVVAGNDYLGTRAQAAGARRVEIVPTVVDLDRYSPAPARSDGTVTIGWIGSPNTAPYLDPVKPVVESLAASARVRAIAIGARPDQVADSPFEAVPWTEEGEIDALRGIDIGIMPLQDTPWERGKCGYKLIQYMALGRPVVASPVGVNRTIVQNGVNGFLAGDASEWREALEQLVRSASLRLAFGVAGKSLVEQEFSQHIWAERSANLFRTVLR